MPARIAIRLYARPFEPAISVAPQHYDPDRDEMKRVVGAVLSDPIDLGNPPKMDDLPSVFPKGSWIDDRAAQSANTTPSENFIFGEIKIPTGMGFTQIPYGRQILVLQVDVIYGGKSIFSRHLTVIRPEESKRRFGSVVASSHIPAGALKPVDQWPFQVFSGMCTTAFGEEIKHGLVHGERSHAGIVAKNTPMGLMGNPEGGDAGRSITRDWSQVAVAISRFHYLYLLSQIQAAVKGPPSIPPGSPPMSPEDTDAPAEDETA